MHRSEDRRTARRTQRAYGPVSIQQPLSVRLDHQPRKPFKRDLVRHAALPESLGLIQGSACCAV